SAVVILLGDSRARDGEAVWLAEAVNDPAVSLQDFQAPRGYRPPLPVPLWAQVVELGTRGETRPEGGDEPPNDRQTEAAIQGKRKAERRRQDQAERKDSLIFNPFDKMRSFSEMENLNRRVDDEED